MSARRARAPPRESLGRRGFSPLLPGDPATLLERGSSYLPLERERLEAWGAWDRERRKTPYGARVAGSVEGWLREERVPAPLSRRLGRRTVYRWVPLAGRPVEGPLVRLPPDVPPPRASRPYRMHRPTRRLVGWATRAGAWEVSELLEVSDLEPVGEDRAVSVPQDRHANEATLRALADGAGVGRPVVESLLLPFVGAPPWQGRRAGLDLVAGSLGAPASAFAAVALSLGRLLPPWEVRTRRTRRPHAADVRDRAPQGSPRVAGPSAPVPYRVELLPLGPRGWDLLLSSSKGEDASTLLFGGVDARTLSSVLLEPHLPMLEPVDVWMDLAEAPWSPELTGTVSDTLLRRRSWDPWVSSEEHWRSWLTQGLERLRPRLEEVLALAPGSGGGSALSPSSPRPLGERLTQVALARARWRGAREVTRSDLDFATERYLASLDAVPVDEPRRVRELLQPVESPSRTGPSRRAMIIRALLLERGALAASDVADRLGSRAPWRGKVEIERDLDALSAQGCLLRQRDEGLRWVGD